MTHSNYLAGATGRLREHTGTLGVALVEWATRDGTKFPVETRQAANTAMDAIDEMLHVLHRTRETLIAEIRLHDAAAAARVDAMLARLRHERPGGRP